MDDNKAQGSIVLENREKLFLYGVSESESFDDASAVFVTNLGRIVIDGRNLHLAKLSLESGEAVVDGYISALRYVEKRTSGKENIITRIFK